MYSYFRTAAKKKKPVAEEQEEKKPKKKPKAKPEDDDSEESSRTDGAKPGEVEVAINAIESALDAVHDCAPNGKDYREDGDFDSRAYQKEVEAHSERIHALNDIREQLHELLAYSEKNTKTASYDRRASDLTADSTDKLAASTTMRPNTWYFQNAGGHELWFLAQKEQKNGGFAGKLVRWQTRNPKSINDSVPKSFWSLWKELPDSEVPAEVKDAV